MLAKLASTKRFVTVGLELRQSCLVLALFRRRVILILDEFVLALGKDDKAGKGRIPDALFRYECATIDAYITESLRNREHLIARLQDGDIKNPSAGKRHLEARLQRQRVIGGPWKFRTSNQSL